MSATTNTKDQKIYIYQTTLNPLYILRSFFIIYYPSFLRLVSANCIIGFVSAGRCDLPVVVEIDNHTHHHRAHQPFGAPY